MYNNINEIVRLNPKSASHQEGIALFLVQTALLGSMAFSKRIVRWYHIFAFLLLSSDLDVVTAFSSGAPTGVKKGVEYTEHSRIRTDQPHIVFPGGGIFFYWQAGVVCYLREHGYDMSQCTFSGASAGALTGTLASTDVDFYKATDLALQLAANARVWDRPLGLQGVWGPLIEEWLDALLPESISCVQGRLLLLVTPVPSLGKRQVTCFENKQDLIRCNMASVHLPWFLDGNMTSNFRGEPHLDGSFLSTWSDYLSTRQKEGPILFIDWKKDPWMASKGMLSFVETLSPDGIWDLVKRGKQYAEQMEIEGEFVHIPRI